VISSRGEENVTESAGATKKGKEKEKEKGKERE
jgi:hypothetical protein